MDNYGKILRDFINFQTCLNAVFNSCASEWCKRKEFQENLNYQTVKQLFVMALDNHFDSVSMDEESIKQRSRKEAYVLCVLQVYVDVYKILNLREKLGIINDLDASLLEKLRKCVSIEDIGEALMHEAVAPLMAEAVNFSDLCIYDKVLQTKSLDKEDIEKLKSIFPLFEGEYEAYNVEVDEAFMIRQMKKRTGPWKENPEKCYEDAANFLDQYSILNNSLYKKISETVGCTSLNNTKSMLKKLIGL